MATDTKQNNLDIQRDIQEVHSLVSDSITFLAFLDSEKNYKHHKVFPYLLSDSAMQLLQKIMDILEKHNPDKTEE